MVQVFGLILVQAVPLLVLTIVRTGHQGIHITPM